MGKSNYRLFRINKNSQNLGSSAKSGVRGNFIDFDLFFRKKTENRWNKLEARKKINWKKVKVRDLKS